MPHGTLPVIKNSSKLRGKINEVESYAQLEALLEQWLAEEA